MLIKNLRRHTIAGVDMVDDRWSAYLVSGRVARRVHHVVHGLQGPSAIRGLL
jgi:hypothetical protein